jgi:acetyltransferase-like isoleucine patch superfamily enzyme
MMLIVVLKKKIANVIKKVFYKLFKELRPFYYRDISLVENSFHSVEINKLTKLYKPYKVSNAKIGKGTYIAQNANISDVEIGKFCSIGANFVCGWGIHPTNGISTSPYFYSKKKQNGHSIAKKNLIKERERITIGNDVFIGLNVTILDGVSIGDGAVIGAGAVVSKDIPPYAIAVGCPIKIINYRFNNDIINELLKIKWWDFDDNKLQDVENYFFNVEEFIRSNHNKNI